MCAHDEDQDEYLTSSQDPVSCWTCDQPATVCEGLHGRMGDSEFANNPACICGNQAEEEDAEKAGDEAKDCKGLGQSEDAERYVLGQHEDACVPPELLARGTAC
jgi:hypothetical protein